MNKKPPLSNIYLEKLDLYEKLVETIPGLERKGATMPYTSLNGHMFSFLNKEGVIGLRLPGGVREQFLEKYATNLCEEYGTILKEYVSVPEDLLKKTQELKQYFLISFDYVKSLKPKNPSKK